MATTPYTLPLIPATTPTVFSGVTYGSWAVTAAVIIEETDPEGPADPSGPHWPLDLRFNCVKGRIHPDGYFDPSPVDNPVSFQIDDIVKQAATDLNLANLLNSTVTAIGNKGKALGIL